MNPAPDPTLILNLMFALMLACAVVPAPEVGLHADPRVTSRFDAHAPFASGLSR